MSEKIKIAVVIDDGKTNTDEKGKKEPSLFLTQDSFVTLMPVLLQNQLMKGSFCGGRGACGRCVVQFLQGTPLPTGVERARFTPQELRQGYRLACVTRPKTDCVVRIVDVGDRETPIVTEMNLPSESIDQNSHKKVLSENWKSTATKLGVCQTTGSENGLFENNRYIIAVDLGTTTIAMQLRDMITGETADTWCGRNPQRIYGTDVLSRIEAACNGNREELQRLVCGSLAQGLRQFGARTDGGREIACMCIAGNTVMQHLLMGYEVLSLGRAPFVPAETGLQEVSASVLFTGEAAEPADVGNLQFPVYIAPCISAFVGGDIVAGLYALHMIPGLHRQGTEKEGTAERVRLLIDLGTNGEMAVTDGQRMVVTATAAGPAFEGNGDLIGTDRIALTARLLERGMLDETGLFAEPFFEEGVRIETEDGREAVLRQEDIRALQLAKAAVRAGVEILWEEMERPVTDCVYLAGGFGYYLDVEAAFAIGLLPSRMRGRVQAVGNTSLAGAYLLGRDLTTGALAKDDLEKMLAVMENGNLRSVNLAKQEGFEKLYLQYMNLEKN